MENTIINNNSLEDQEEVIPKNFEELLKDLNSLKTHLSTIINATKMLDKQVKKELKNKDKINKSKKPGPKKPSGFAKPSKISDELCNFLKVPKKSELARTDVTKRIISYIKDNNLENEENKKIIKCDTNLKKLLKCNDEEVTYFNIQRFMNVHFIKSQPATLSFE